MSNSTLREVNHIAKFDGKNFSLWKFGCWLLLEQHNLIKIVNGEETLPEEVIHRGNVTNAAAIADWHKRDVLARNYLVSTIETQQQRTLVNCTTAHAMWVRLSTQYLRNAVENQHVLQQKFFEYQFQPDHDIMTHITEIEMMASQLEDVGAPVTPIQIMTKIICTLPPSYRNFTTSWDSVPADDKTLELLTSRLLKEETMAKRWNGGKTDAEDEAFFAHNFPSHRPQNSNQRGKTGRGRGKKHDRTANHPYTKCTYCNKGWHTAEICRHRIRDEAKAKEPKEKEKMSTALPANSDQHEEEEDHGLLSSSISLIARCTTDWYADSGATQHMTDQRPFFKTFTPVEPNTWMVNGIGNTRLSVRGYGNVQFTSNVQGIKRIATFEMVLFVPGLGTNLLSIAAITDAGLTVLFVGPHVKFTKNKTTVLVGERVGRRLYHLAITPTLLQCHVGEDFACFAVPPTPSMALWHQRLAHISCKKILTMASQNLVDGLVIPSDGAIPAEPCIGCLSGKMHRSPFPIGRTRANQIGQLIHSDVCGPMQVPTPKGSRYFVLFTDDFSGWRVIYFLQEKSEVPEYFKTYVRQLHGETGHFVRTLRTDNGGEYFSHAFNEWLSKKGIRHESSVPHTPEQNGVAERANRTILEGGRCLLYAHHIPLELWAEALSCTVYVLNRVTTKACPLTPYQNWHGSKPNVSNLRVFGSRAFIHIPKAERRKLDSKSLECFFVGYSLTQKAYRFWDPLDRRIKISRDVVFDEQLFPTDLSSSRNHQDKSRADNIKLLLPTFSSKTHTDSSPDLIPNSVDSSTTSVVQTNIPEQPSMQIGAPPCSNSTNSSDPITGPQSSVERVRYSPYPMRHRTPKTFFDAYLADHAISDCNDEPGSYAEAMESTDAPLWKLAISDEYNSLLENQTWSLTPLPPGRAAIKCRWLFKIKTGGPHSAPRYKARLVAGGYSQRSGIDYGETYAPVAKHDTLRVILSIVAAYDLEMMQLDIKTAFLYGELDEEIYMRQPEGFVATGQENLVCRLHKSLYGLKQASRVWNKHFDTFLREFGLQTSNADPCLYTRRQENEFIMVVIWVDDGLVCSNSSIAINNIIEYLGKHFSMRSTTADHFVGLSITRMRKEKLLYLSQPEYINKILKKFHMNNCHPRRIPADPNARLQKQTDENTTVNAPYREAIGSLMYLMLTSRPDIAFAVGQVSQFCENPGQEHWNAVKRIFAYLQGTKGHGIRFGNVKDLLKGYTDADYAGDLDTRHSTSGFIFILNGGPVAWGSRKQSCVALSTTEAEYIAAGEATKEGIWLRRLLMDLNPNWNDSLPLLCDNQSAVRLIKNPEFHRRTKHIDIRYHFIREHCETKTINVLYVSTENQLADPFTKSLPSPRFTNLRETMGIVAVPDN